ncbi:hypothetical protein PS684_05457 [Pseudomonas fluorescens]|nr:hypothetical protein PS684_05457 [Pseudomonas fluorescens]
MAVVFEVYDCVFNRSEDWSAEQRIVVAVDATRLGAPLLKETLNNVLDVDKLGDADGTVQIIATDTSKFTVGDIPYIRIKGTPVEGPPIDLEVEGAALTSVPSVTDDKVPNAVLRQLAKSQITLSYRLEKADASPDLRSKGQFIRAIGEVQRLAAPIMRDAVSGTLNPNLEHVRVEIPFDKSFAEGQVLKIFMLGTTPGLKPYLPDLPTRLITRNDIVAAQPLLYNIDGKHLAPVNGGKAEFYYQQLIAETVLATLDPYETTRAIRESIHTAILQVGEARLELPQPQVAGVVNGVLPADTAGTTLTVVYTETVKGDEVFMFWHGSITGEYTDSIKLNEFTAGQPVPFPIGAELIKGNEGGSVIARYEIKRAAGGTSYAEPLKFDVGVALDLTAPDIKEAPNGTSLDSFAGKDTLTAVVDYVGMLLDDEIIVTFSGAPGTPEGGSHITAPWTVRTLGAQDIPLDNTVIAFNLGQSVTVSYTVARGSDDPKDSKTRTLAVLPIQNEDNRLPDPVINGITSAELDVTTLPGQPRTRIAAWLLLALKQTLWLRYFVEGNPTPISTTYNGAVIPPDGVPGGMQPYTPMTELNKLTDGAKLRIEFKVGFDGSTDESKAVVFPSRVYTVKAFATPLQPSLKEAAGSNSLNPFAAKDTLTVVVPHYTGMAGTDQISVTWTGATGTPDGGSHTSTAVPVGTVGAKEIPIPNTVVAFNLGKAVTVFYTVIRNGTPTKSEEFTLNVQTIPNEDSRLPNPIINTNTTSELDVITLPANAQTRIAAWLLISVKATIWLRYFVEGNPTPISVTYSGDLVPPEGVSGGMYPNTPVTELKALADGVKLRIEFKVGFDGSKDESKAVAFPVRKYTVKSVPALIIDVSPMEISGRNLSIEGTGLTWTRTGKDPAGTTADRTPSSGVQPYTYRSENNGIASVEATTGRVRSEWNGTTRIIVTDSLKRSASYEVTVSNVIKLRANQTGLSIRQGYNWRVSIGGTLITDSDVPLFNKYTIGKQINFVYLGLPLVPVEHLPGHIWYHDLIDWSHIYKPWRMSTRGTVAPEDIDKPQQITFVCF